MKTLTQSHRLSLSRARTGYKWSSDMKIRLSIAAKKAGTGKWMKDKVGPLNSQWQGDNVSVRGIHVWLNRCFGKTRVCENVNCPGISNFYDWSKLRGKKYERKRENFWRLCRTCHNRYDGKNYKKYNVTKTKI